MIIKNLVGLIKKKTIKYQQIFITFMNSQIRK